MFRSRKVKSLELLIDSLNYQIDELRDGQIALKAELNACRSYSDKVVRQKDELGVKNLRLKREYDDLLTRLREQNRADILYSVERIKDEVLHGDKKNAEEMKEKILQPLMDRRAKLQELAQIQFQSQMSGYGLSQNPLNNLLSGLGVSLGGLLNDRR